MPVKICILLVLGGIAYQDIKDRLVWWFLFPLYGAMGGYLFYEASMKETYFLVILINLMVVAIMLLSAYLYSRLKMKKQFSKSFALGDTLFLIAFALCFPTLTLLVFLVFSMVFALVIHGLLSVRFKRTTVPLAGYMALFLAAIYLVSWSGLYKSLYLL